MTVVERKLSGRKTACMKEEISEVEKTKTQLEEETRAEEPRAVVETCVCSKKNNM